MLGMFVAKILVIRFGMRMHWGREKRKVLMKSSFKIVREENDYE